MSEDAPLIELQPDEPVILFDSNNYEGWKQYNEDDEESDMSYWLHMTVTEVPSSGKRTVTVTELPFTVSPQEVAPNSMSTEFDPEDDLPVEDELHLDITKTRGLLLTPAGNVLRFFGFAYSEARTDGGHTSISMTYPIAATVGEKLADLRRWVDFMPDLHPVEGPFTPAQLGTAAKENAFTASATLPDEPHDMIAHLPGWLSLTRKGYKSVGHHLGRLRSERAISYYLTAIDGSIDNNLAMGLFSSLNDAQQRRVLESSVYDIHFTSGQGELMPKPERVMLVDAEIKAMRERWVRLSDAVAQIEAQAA